MESEMETAKKAEKKMAENIDNSPSKEIKHLRSGGSHPPERRGAQEQVSGIVSIKGSGVPDPEVPAKARRRIFTAQYKKEILQEADTLKNTPGAIGALLRREGLYSSHLVSWRRQRTKGELDGLSPRKRGRKNQPQNPLTNKVKELESENRRLQKKLEKAETIISFQKKLSEMLGISLDHQEERSGTH